MTINSNKPRLVISTGEPAGIGPDIIIQLLHHYPDYNNLTLLIDPDLFSARVKQLGLDVKLPPCIYNFEEIKNKTVIYPIKLKTNVVAGKLDIANAEYLLEMLKTAFAFCKNKSHQAIVTGPLQKSIINDAGYLFTGHTEYLAELSGGNVLPVMLLSTPELNIALATTHLQLRDVADAITKNRLQQTIEIIFNDMRNRFGIKEPRMIVCGLNPHAGESGHLGKEEMNIIQPVIDMFRSRGEHIVGPLPADTAFRKELRDKHDVYLAMYHDQGLPVLKTLGFGEAVNITLGLPIIRTSVDHGTALELAGSGKADFRSLQAAITMAEHLANNYFTSNG